MAFSLPLEQLYALLSHYFFITVRLAALLTAAPVFGENGVPKRVRIGLAVLAAVLIGGHLPESGIGVYSWQGVWVIAKQVIIGASIGLAMQLLFATVRMAGEIIGMQMGLSFATFFDPAAGNSPVIARFLNLLVTLLFLVFNGHLWLIAFLAESFHQLPVNDAPLHAGGFLYLVQQAGIIFRQGLMLGLPIISVLLCINFTLGLLNRLTPQLSIFVVGFPLTLTAGMVALSLIAQTLAPFFERLMASGFENLSTLIMAFS
ncbi:flagellar biosynthetic protein FliR [Cedecea sp.]|jgi:flagellar biosynthetic protein FliR|uniref:flagellar biosynthetic protein FliR n=1 Tax=Cedecea sp. TaxID=1970739 RepID=UPI0012AD87EB|nr:flagellar biosynthetic protein FliR [Enterobacteriaceae bacterium RIT693]